MQPYESHINLQVQTTYIPNIDQHPPITAQISQPPIVIAATSTYHYINSILPPISNYSISTSNSQHQYCPLHHQQQNDPQLSDLAKELQYMKSLLKNMKHGHQKKTYTFEEICPFFDDHINTITIKGADNPTTPQRGRVILQSTSNPPANCNVTTRHGRVNI